MISPNQVSLARKEPPNQSCSLSHGVTTYLSFEVPLKFKYYVTLKKKRFKDYES